MVDSPAIPDRRLIELASCLEPGRALDVGCGTGANSLWLADNEWTVTAIDVSARAVNITRKKAINWGVPLATVRVDGREFAPDEPFDFIAVCYLHLRDQIRKRLLRNLVSLLDENGTILWRSFEAQTEDPGYAANLLPTSQDIVEELGADLTVQQAVAKTEYFPYLNREVRLLTVQAQRFTEYP